MAKTREQKEKIVNGLIDKLSKVKSIVFVNFFGLKVNDINELRNLCKKEDVDYLVVKKTLLKRAFEEANYKNIPEFNGEIALALSYKDEISSAKILDQFAKDHEALKIVGGVLENRYVEAGQILNLAKLPSKTELLTKIVGGINAPISGFVNTLSGSLRNLVYILNAIKEIKS